MRAALVILFVALVGCSLAPPGQILLTIDTNAPVPPGDGRSLTTSDPVPLFDTLRVELFEPGQTTPCAACVNEFALDTKRLTEEKVSIGLKLKPGVSGFLVRLTLFSQDMLVTCDLIAPGEQNEECAANPQATVAHRATIVQTTARVPIVPKEGIVAANVFLDVDTVGRPSGTLDAPVDAITLGAPKPSLVGTWSGAQRRWCDPNNKPRDGEVCVPSGAFWMGNVPWAKRGTAPRSVANVVDSGYTTISPRLVILSPFYMKATEVTVEECKRVAACDASVAQTSNNLGGSQCSYLPPDPKLPVDPKRALSCAKGDARDAFCHAWGGEVATAAQIEYVARGTTGRTFPWGDSIPTCDDAMWGREWRYGEKQPCADPKNIGPYRPGLGLLDHVDLPGGSIVDLAGNLQEITRDVVPKGCVCPWPEELLRDPVCVTAAPWGNPVLAGTWSYGARNLAVVPGQCYALDWFYSGVAGFRCTRPGE